MKNATIYGKNFAHIGRNIKTREKQMTQKNLENPEQEQAQQVDTVSSAKDIEPLDYSSLYDGVLYQFTHGQLGDSEEKISEIFKKYFGEKAATKKSYGKKDRKQLTAIVEDVLQQKLHEIKIKSTSLVPDNINSSIAGLLNIMCLDLDFSNISLDTCKEALKQRCGDVKELKETCEVLWLGRRLFDWYNAGIVSPEINADVMQMQDFYRKGTIDREVLAWHYYNVGMVYENYSSHKNNQQAISAEHNRAVKFMKKALNKTDTNISLIMTIKDFLSDEPHYNPQSVLDACHRIMDNNDDNQSLYLAHKLYAETLTENRRIKGLNAEDNNQKILDHYNIALSYTNSSEDKLDILEAISNYQKGADKDGYIKTLVQMTNLQTGRNRIRALKHLTNLVESSQMKTVFLKTAINEFLDLDNIRGEDIAMYRSLDSKLRAVAAGDAKTIKKLDSLRDKILPQTENEQTQQFVFTQMSSKGNDIF